MRAFSCASFVCACGATSCAWRWATTCCYVVVIEVGVCVTRCDVAETRRQKVEALGTSDELVIRGLVFDLKQDFMFGEEHDKYTGTGRQGKEQTEPVVATWTQCFRKYLRCYENR